MKCNRCVLRCSHQNSNSGYRLSILVIEAGVLTPPFGISVFVVKAVHRHRSVLDPHPVRRRGYLCMAADRHVAAGESLMLGRFVSCQSCLRVDILCRWQ
jgi:hypothetical protein